MLYNISKSILLIFNILISFSLLYSQQDTATHDPQAKIILENLSKKTASYDAIRMYFNYITVNRIDSTEESFDGYLYIRGKDKYKFIVPNNEVFSNGTKTWAYLKKEGEITVTWVDPNDKNVLTPKNLLTIYEIGFKYRYLGELDTEIKIKDGKNISNVMKTLYIIDLYPESVKQTPYSIIRIWIDKTDMRITNIRYFGKDEFDFVVDILEFNTTTTIPDLLFEFNEKNYPADIEIIDTTN